MIDSFSKIKPNHRKMEAPIDITFIYDLLKDIYEVDTISKGGL